MNKDATDMPETRSAASDADSRALQLSSRDLFQQTNTVRIEHNGDYYCLRLTRGNKLILTK